MTIHNIPNIPGPSLPDLIPVDALPSFAGEKKAEKAAEEVPADKVEKGAQQADEKEWTFLYYMNGNNWMHKQMPGMVRQLEMVGSNDKVDHVAQVSRQKTWSDGIVGDWSGARRYHIDKNEEGGGILTTLKNSLLGGLPPYTKGIGSEMVEDMGKVDMGAPETLKDFIEWGMQKYPAKHYALVLVGPSQGFYGTMKDEETGSDLSAKELKGALAGAQKATGKKLDLLTMNMSSGNSVEMAYQLKDQAKYMVGTEGVLAGDGLPLVSVNAEVEQAYEHGGLDPKEMAQTYTMVGSMSPTSPYFSPTVSAIDLSKMDEVKDAMNNLAQGLLNAKVDPGKLRKILYHTQEVNIAGSKNVSTYEGMKDPYHFAQMVAKDPEIKDASVKQACQEVMLSIDNAMVGEAFTTGAFMNTHGMSAFIPNKYGFMRPDSFPVPADHCRKFDYEFTDFGQDTAWPKLLEHIAKDSLGNRVAKGVGIGEATLDKAHGLGKSLAPTIAKASGWASTIGWWESYNVMSSGTPQPVFGIIPGKPAAMAGVWGGAWDTFHAVKGAVVAGKKYKSVDGVVLKSFDAVRSACKGFSNLSLLVPSLLPYGQMAGVVSFFGPWLKDVFTGWVNYKSIRDGVIMGQQGVESKSEAMKLAMDVHRKQNVVWDK